MSRGPETKGREENEVEFARIVAFSDGVFAIAITLLVLNLSIDSDLPKDDLGQAIWGMRDAFVAYGISFAVIGRFWLLHHRFFADVKAFDARLLWLNILYLAFIVLIPFSSDLLGEYGGETTSVVVYAVDISACVLIGMWMSLYAHRAGLTVGAYEQKRETWFRAAFIAAVFLASVPVAVLVPDYAPLMWLVMFLDPTQRILGGAAG